MESILNKRQITTTNNTTSNDVRVELSNTSKLNSSQISKLIIKKENCSDMRPGKC